MTPWPVPAWLMVKIAGEGLAKLTVIGVLATPKVLMVIETCDDPMNSQGIWKLIWFGDTKNKGAAIGPMAAAAAPSLLSTDFPTPDTSTWVWATRSSMLGSGVDVAAAVVVARFVP